MHKRYTSLRDVYRLFCEIYREAGTAARSYLSKQGERVSVLRRYCILKGFLHNYMRFLGVFLVYSEVINR